MSRFKTKFIQIWNLNEKMQREAEESETSVGPQNFLPLMKLG